VSLSAKKSQKNFENKNNGLNFNLSKFKKIQPGGPNSGNFTFTYFPPKTSLLSVSYSFAKKLKTFLQKEKIYLTLENDFLPLNRLILDRMFYV